jgi:RNA polymerase sigma-70 factor (ECF subfamily)
MRHDEVIPTRASLLDRLKDLGDASSWDEFHRTYRELIFSVARRAGLNETEADEVVQDTLIFVAKKMPGFTYDPAKDSFKGWLLTLTRWWILDQFEKRKRVNPASPALRAPSPIRWERDGVRVLCPTTPHHAPRRWSASPIRRDSI